MYSSFPIQCKLLVFLWPGLVFTLSWAQGKMTEYKVHYCYYRYRYVCVPVSISIRMCTI